MKFSKSISILSFCFLLACASAARAGYIDNLDGTVTDTDTGLMWQQATAPDIYTWEQAHAYCENLTLATHTDWRLPTAKELNSLTDNNQYNPAINTTYFPDTVAAHYWSSTTNAYIYGTDYAWYVDFYYGGVYSSSKANFNFVRAVRSGQPGSFDNLTLWPVPDTGQTKCYDNTTEIICPQPGQPFYGQDASYSINTPAYTKLAAGGTALSDNATSWDMVRDDVTGLVWEEKHNMNNVKDYANSNDADNTYTWYDTNPATNGGNAGTPGDGTDTEDFINTLNTANYGGYSDWRMPTEKELQSIVDYSIFFPIPSINTAYFPNSVVSYYWSSTTYSVNFNAAWIVSFYYGSVESGNKTFGTYVRAVRSGQSGSFADLVISKSGTGTGLVTSTDGKINCGSDCSEAYTRITGVTLTATAASGSIFTGWTGGGCSGTDSCMVTLKENLTVTANFDLVPTTTTTQPTTTSSVSLITTSTTTTQPTTTSSVSSTTTTTILAETCEFTVSPIRKISFLFFPIPLRIITLTASDDVTLSSGDTLDWGTEALRTLSVRVSPRKPGQARAIVLIRPLQLDRGTYDVKFGNCEGTLEVK